MRVDKNLILGKLLEFKLKLKKINGDLWKYIVRMTDNFSVEEKVISDYV